MRLPSWRRPTSDAARRYARTAIVPASTPWRSASYCVLDLEATGLNFPTDEILSFAAVPIDAARIVISRTVEGLVRPIRPPDARSIIVHGLVPSDLATAPLLDEAIEPLLDALAGRVLVAHSAWVERGLLRRALRGKGVRLRDPIVDTNLLGRLWLAERDRRLPDRVSLGSLATALGLPEHAPHTAAGDALTTAQVFLACATHLDALAPETVGTLARADERIRALRQFPP